METKPKISVLIPISGNIELARQTSNLMRCLESLIYQSYENVEIVILSPYDRESLYEAIKGISKQNEDKIQVHTVASCHN